MIYSDLKIYKLATELQIEVDNLLAPVCNNWNIPEIKQVIRSTSSVCANISEGFARRIYPKDYSRFLIIALGSSDESQFHMDSLIRKRVLDPSAGGELKRKYKDLSIRTLNLINFIKKENKF